MLNSVCSRGAQARRFIVVLAATLTCLAAGAASAWAAPAISITAGPSEGSATKATQISFSLSASVPDTNDVDFYCSIDDAVNYAACSAAAYPLCVAAGGGMNTCTQNKNYIGLAAGTHVFRAFASDCASPCDPFYDGNDGPLVTRTFTVDRTAPVVTITGGPNTDTNVVTRPGAAFSFIADEAVTFFCAVDQPAGSPCGPTFTLGSLTNGIHQFTLKAVDPAGNETVITQQFKVDIFKPKKCKKGKSAKAKAKYRKCKKANAKAKAKWKQKYGLR